MKLKIGLTALLIALTLSNTHAEMDEVDHVLSNMFYENYFWDERKLTDQEKKQADYFIDAIVNEAEKGQGHAMTRFMDGDQTLNDDRYNTAMRCDRLSALSTALSLYRSQSEYYPEYRSIQNELELLFNKINITPSTASSPNVQRCKALNYWMPYVDLFE